MAVNLLALANKLGSGLGSGSSGSRTRSSYQNQPGNLKRGTYIPGTNLKEDQGIKSIAKKGRKGDTKIRRVKGQPSHVNTAEARAIDTLGPIGEAWVQSIGSGTINPKTGLTEYASWRPSQGKWGVFGQSKKSKARDRAKAQAAARHRTFEDFRRKYENENIAGIWTADDNVDDTDLIKSGGYGSGGNPKFEDLVTDLSGLVKTPEQAQIEKEKAMKVGQKYMGITTEEISEAGGIAATTQEESNVNDIADYLDAYDPRKQDELTDNYTRDLERLGIQEDKAFTADIQNQQTVGSQISSGLFGMLTQAKQKSADQGFAGAGDFAAQFAQKQAITDAERQVNAGRTDREMTLEGLEIDTEQAVADLASGTKDLQEDYNQEFWNSMVSWDSAINA